jgi:NAD-specific glutamate dehydrogenase
VLQTGGRDADPQAAIDAWSESNAETLDRALGMLADIRASRIYDNTTLPVALREIRTLLRGASRTGAAVGSVTMAE